MYSKQVEKYVPKPTRVTSDTYIACHYYPGWEVGGDVPHGGMLDLVNYPERTPIQGYYDGKNPEVIDWEIKWACEHGINCFIFCWYRYRENMGKPLTGESVRLGATLHEGFFKAKYQHYMDFAIMWECDTTWGTAADQEDLCHNILPFWVENYFSKPNYMKIDGKPVVFVFGPANAIKEFGSTEESKIAFEACKEEIKKYGFEGMIFSAEQYQPDMKQLGERLSAGFDCSFQYGNAPLKFTVSSDLVEEYHKTMQLPEGFPMAYQLERIEERIQNYPGQCMFTASCFRDTSEVWEARFRRTRLSDCTLMWKLSPVEFKELLKRLKERVSRLPKEDIGRRIVILDNWNEWGEGHYIAPCAEHGFQYLQAVREVFTECDNLPDYRLPDVIGLGPYDGQYIDERGKMKRIELGKTQFL